MTTNNEIINISRENVLGNCDFRCSFDFKYDTLSGINNPNNNLKISNYGNKLVLPIDHRLNHSITYNTFPYNVLALLIVSPSIHKFNNEKTDGEILIEHFPTSGGKSLFVCIPFKEGTPSSYSDNSPSFYLTNMILSAKSTINNQSENNASQINLTELNLNNFVPKKPFFTYTGNHIVESFMSDYIVFGIDDAIKISNRNDNVIDVLSEIITPLSIQMRGNSLFYNTYGPNNAVLTNLVNTSTSAPPNRVPFVDTATSSVPTNTTTPNTTTPNTATDTSTANESEKKTQDFNIYSIIYSKYFIIILQIIFNILFFIGLFFLINYIFNYFTLTNRKSIYNTVPTTT